MVVFIHVTAFLSVSPLRLPQIEMLQKHTHLETRDREQGRALTISTHACGDGPPEAPAVGLRLPAPSADWVLLVDSRRHSASGKVGAIAYQSRKEREKAHENTGAIQGPAPTYSW